MKSSEIEAIRDATSDAIDCLFILQDAAVKHKAIKSEATTKRFIETAYRLEGVTNVLAAALCGRFDSFAAVAPALVRFGPLVLASAHEAIHSGCRILVSEIAEGIMEHHFPNWPPRGQETRMPDALVCEADFAVAIDAAVEAYFNAGFSESDMNDLSALLRQEQARLIQSPADITEWSMPDKREVWANRFGEVSIRTLENWAKDGSLVWKLYGSNEWRVDVSCPRYVKWNQKRLKI